MGLFDWLDSNITKMRWYDISLIKLSVFFSTLFLLTAWSSFRDVALRIGWQWYLGLAIITMVPILKKMFSK